MREIPVRYIDANEETTGFSQRFIIRNLQDMLNGADMVQKLHRHDFFFILILEQGSGHHEIDFTPYPIRDHSIFFLRPGQVHELVLESDSTGFLIEFNPDFYHPNDTASNQRLRQISSKDHCLVDASRFPKLVSVLEQIFREYSDREEGFQEAIKANLDLFFIELARQSKHQSPTEVPPYVQERMDALMELLEGNISTYKQVKDYADLMHLSPYQLNAITREALGKTCSEVINNYIILEARRYLLATSNQVKEIAYHLGYEDSSYFIRFFKKHTGLSPDAFRQQYK